MMRLTMTTPRYAPASSRLFAHLPGRLRLALVAGLVLFAANAIAQNASSQSDIGRSATTRVVAVPLQGPPELAPWQLGIATALQRSLNVIDGVYVPPIGDAVVLAERADAAGGDAGAAVRERFEADLLLGGRVASAPAGLDVTLERVDTSGEVSSHTVTVSADPATAMPLIVEAAIEVLGLEATPSDVTAALAVAAQAPSVEGLRAVALASSRLVAPDEAALRAADELAPGRSWILAERARAASLAGRHDEARALASTATDAQPEDVEAWTIRAVVALRAGEREASAQAYRTALERNPSHAIARAGLAGTLSGENALREYQRALDAYPRLLEAHLAIAEIQGGARGLQTLRSAAAWLPDSVRLHRTVLQRVVAAGDPAGAVRYLRDVLEQPLARSADGFALAAELPPGRNEAARELLARGAEEFPSDVSLALAEARFLRELGEAAAAEARLRPFAEAAPDDARIANALALTLVAQQRLAEAREVLDVVSDNSATVRFNLAQALLEAGLPRAAVEELAPDMEGDAADAPADPEVWAVYGTALAGAGRFELAREALARALELDAEQPLALRTLRRLEERAEVAPGTSEALPPEARAAFDRGLTHLEQGRNEQAATELRIAYDATPGETPLLAFYLANALQRDGRVAEALELYDEVVEAFPESGTVLNNYGFAWLQVGRYDRALTTLREAVALAPDNARAHLNLGLTYYGLSRFGDALAEWDVATELDPSLAPSIEETRRRAERQLPDAP